MNVSDAVDAAAIAASLDAHEDAHLADDQRSLVLTHGARTERVTVLLHGLTASPRAWKAFAELRHARGESVLAPRLPRHGYTDRMTDALAALTGAELRASAKRIIDAAALMGDRITVVGFSLGGTLALHLGHEDARIERVLAVAPFLGIASVPHSFSRLARFLLARTRNRFVFWDPVDRGRTDPQHGYPRYATRALGAALGLAAALRTDARNGPPKARSIAIVRNQFETAVNNSAIDDLVARWRDVGAKGIHVHRLIGLGPSHDIIEPERKNAHAKKFLPHLHALLDDAAADRDIVIDTRD